MTDVESPRAGLPGGLELTTAGFPGAGFRGPGLVPDGVTGAPALSDRLTALALITQIGSARSGHDGFDPGLLREAEDLLDRAGERLRLSAEHTVVVLAGGTGSGKSSLFNRLTSADFSPVGVVRPMTREAYACVWGMEGAGPLLDWLGVADRNRHARSSELDAGESSLGGLVLLDLPDHDSVLAGATGSVNRLVSLADLMVWVLDPQKYADAAVHRRYLVPMAGHSSVISLVLNQADLLTAQEAHDCVEDLQRLLENDGLHDSQVLVTSAVTGAGVAELRQVLVGTMSARRASTARIAADVDALAARFAPYAGQAGPADPEQHSDALVTAFAQAAGVAGVGRALQSARELKAVDYVGWPVSWLADRLLRRDPVRKIRLGTLWEELRSMSAGPAGAHRAEIDNAITALSDGVAPGLPAPWPATTRSAARSQVDAIPSALGRAIADALPAENSAALWWRLVAVWQGLLLGGAVAGLAWLVVLIVAGIFGALQHTTFSNVALLPWIVVMVAAILLLGWLTASGCMTLVARAADREREQAERRMRTEIAGVARRMVLIPVEQELSVYDRFRDELAVARGAS
ncbi:MAG TPA: ABC transporter [Streptosporangiaceae bacterium]|nr:ABC transporter [Streptosporangiaceae bacterium]